MTTAFGTCRNLVKLIDRLRGRGLQVIKELPTPRVKEFHISVTAFGRDENSLETQKKLYVKSNSLFEELAEKRSQDKLTFCSAIQMFIVKDTLYRRGHVEFIYAALEHMERFGVHRDLSVYKALLEVFPKGKMIPRSAWQVEFMHFPKQQQCAIDLMDQMEDFGVIPDHDFGVRLANAFGTEAHAFRKYNRMMYWLPKFKHANPYPVPKELPDDALQLALIALKRMAVDRDNELRVWQTREVDPETNESTFIASGQSKTQQKLITLQNPKLPLFVEGGYKCWLRHFSVTYFILRADPDLAALKAWNEAKIKVESDVGLFDWKSIFEDEEPTQLMPERTIHEQDDGTILAMCVTGTSTKESLVTWIRCLQRTNPALEQIPIVFKLITPSTQIQAIGNKLPV